MAGKLVQRMMGFFVILGWLSWLGVVVMTSPESMAWRFLFFLSLLGALVFTFWIILYWLSFRIYTSKRFQGDLGRTLMQGIPPSLMVVAALWLRSIRAFNLVVGLVLLVLVLGAEYLLFPRTRLKR